MAGWASFRKRENNRHPARGVGGLVELSAEMARLSASLGPLAYAQAPGHGRILQFVAARTGEGTSTVAREFAFFSAQQLNRPVWLVDLDFMGATQFNLISSAPDRYGRVGSAAGASPDGSAFFTVQPQAKDRTGKLVPPARYLVAHPVGGPNLWVTRFRRENLAPGQNVHVVPDASYWDVLRRHADMIIIDAPSAQHSRAAGLIAPHVDASVLVVAADAGDSRPPALLRSALGAAGGKVAGIFYNRSEVEAPGLLKRVLP